MVERGKSSRRPSKYLNLIHLDDAARASVAAFDRGEGGRTYLACDDRPVERREYYDLVARCLGAPTPRFVLPAPEGLEARREETNKRVSNRRLRSELGVQLAYPDITTGV
ncbi:MAG: SDR family NAD(P)-dependent oxidoreductase, partial [Singulisphaera sp.]